MLRVCGAVLFLVGVSICQSCSLSSANGIYDLSPLAYSSSQGSWPSGYDWSNNEAAYTYFINFCEQVSTAISPACFGAGTCQLSGSSNYFNLGVASTATLTEGTLPDDPIKTGVTLTYTDGTYCAQTNTPRQTSISVGCDPSQNPGNITRVVEHEPCNYSIYFSSVYGCPQANNECVFTYSNGSQVSLSGMTLSENQAYEYVTDNAVYYINVCGSTTKGGCSSGTQMCQEMAAGSYSCGMADDHASVHSSTANFIYGSGSMCYQTSSPRETSLSISCDYTTSGRVLSVTETSPCKYQVEMASLHACTQ